MSVNIKNDFGTRKRPDVSSLVYGKIPPQATDLEEVVLGAIMLEKQKLADVVRIIQSDEVFYVDAHQKIYRAIRNLYIKGSPVDILTVTEELRKTQELEIVGGAYYVTKLTMSVSTSAHVDAHARLVLEKYMGRELIRISGDAISAAYDDSEDIFDLLGKVEIGLSSITAQIRSGQIKRIGQSLIEVIKEMKEAQHRPDGMVGLSTGFKKLDHITKGLQRSNTTVVAAGTREGKTTFAVNMGMDIASSGEPAGLLSLEMKDRELIWKVISSEIEEDVTSVQTGNFSLEKWNRLDGDVAKKLTNLPFYIYDQGGLNIVELKAIARTLVAKYGIKVLIVDYIQLVKGVPGKRYGTREELVNEVSKELKALAMELDIPVIILSQLNRIEKMNKGRMYDLSDLRESGAIEQDANNVWFIYRPCLHGVTDFEGVQVTEMDAWLCIAKSRLGSDGKFRLRFDGPFNRFTDYEDRPMDVFTEQAYSAGIKSAGRTFTDITQPKSQQSDDLPF